MVSNLNGFEALDSIPLLPRGWLISFLSGLLQWSQKIVIVLACMKTWSHQRSRAGDSLLPLESSTGERSKAWVAVGGKEQPFLVSFPEAWLQMAWKDPTAGDIPPCSRKLPQSWLYF